MNNYKIYRGQFKRWQLREVQFGQGVEAGRGGGSCFAFKKAVAA